ncbi:hypothetical protein [Halolamina salifodinae]|uniref:DUF7979 domain-containing protein n=1 Tax=Halolamina salifodinae TaxID=1202767 RepID=A0A8T4GRC3_9EURY|nr:hypothetical protein [Halolamina salifodinae]MBP1985691.1 hypothetical protein [Halolamina salifodinae]
MKNHWSLLFVLAVLVGVILASVGSYFLREAYVCSSTGMVSVETATSNAADDAVAFDCLSDRQQELFGRALRNGHVTVNDEFEMPRRVGYENETYAVYRAHGDRCWMITVPAAPVALLGLLLVGFGGRRLGPE